MKNFRLEPGDDLLVVFRLGGSLAQLCWFNRIEPMIDELKNLVSINGRPLSFEDSSKIPYLQVTRKNGKKWKFSMKDYTQTISWLIESLELLKVERKVNKLCPEPLKT